MKKKKQKNATPQFKGVTRPGLYKAIVWAAGLALIAFALLFFESDLLWKAQELNLFQHSAIFFRHHMMVPGGMLAYAATFLTQFFYYPWLGVLILIVCWLLLMWLVGRAFHLPGRWALLAFVPVVCLLLTIVDTGYWLYIMKFHGHFFAATLGALFASFMLWIFQCLPAKYHLRDVFLVLTATVGYPLVGIYALAAALLMAVMSWRMESKGISAVRSIIALLAVVAVPLVCYRYVYHETNLINVYWAGLPIYRVQDRYPLYNIPFCLLALFYVVLAATYRPRRDEQSAKPVRWLIGQLALLAVLAVVAYKGWFKDENFHRELSMLRCVDRLDWEGVLAEAAKQKDEPTRAIVTTQNLALGRLGRQGSEMYYYKNGAKAYNAPLAFRSLLINGPMLYVHYGMPNFCARYTTEMGVVNGWRAEYYKNLSRCALLNGEWNVARKYISQLKQTTFHRKWAEQMEQLIGRPKLIAQHPELGPATHLMHYEDRLYNDQGNVERAIMNHLSAMREVDDPYFQEQALLAALWSQESRFFWYHFERYLKLHPGQPIPIHYQEAAHLYSFLEKRQLPDFIRIDPIVKERYIQFDQTMAQYDGFDIKDVRKATESMFGNTFFYQFYLMSNLPDY